MARLSASLPLGFYALSLHQEQPPPAPPFGFLPPQALPLRRSAPISPPAEPHSCRGLESGRETALVFSAFTHGRPHALNLSSLPICSRAEPSIGLAQAALTRPCCCLQSSYQPLTSGSDAPLPHNRSFLTPWTRSWASSGHSFPTAMLPSVTALNITVPVPPVVGSLYGTGLGLVLWGPQNQPSLNTWCQ